MDPNGPQLCTRCGSRDIVVQTEDYAYCDPCEKAYHQFLLGEYPLGQCQTCGAEGYSWTCARGKKHEVLGFEPGPHHSEGGCGSWRDSDPGDVPDYVPCPV